MIWIVVAAVGAMTLAVASGVIIGLLLAVLIRHGEQPRPHTHFHKSGRSAIPVAGRRREETRHGVTE